MAAAWSQRGFSDCSQLRSSLVASRSFQHISTCWLIYPQISLCCTWVWFHGVSGVCRFAHHENRGPCLLLAWGRCHDLVGDKPKAKGPVAVGFSETPACEGRGITATVKVWNKNSFKNFRKYLKHVYKLQKNSKGYGHGLLQTFADRRLDSLWFAQPRRTLISLQGKGLRLYCRRVYSLRIS